jgi:thiamine biosynthesis protein ThiI
MPAPIILLVRYSEIGLKGLNRGAFEARLCENLRDRLAAAPPLGGEARVTRRRGRVVVAVHAPPDAALEGIAREATARVADTPGVRSVSRSRSAPSTIEALRAAAVEAAGEALRRRVPAPRTFRVRTNRVDKRFPMTSMEVDRDVGAAVATAHPALAVRLDDPDLTIGIDLAAGESFVHADAQAGPGGLPVGASGKVVLLLSGGIDSPVAGFLLQKRGCELATVYCHAFPYVGDAAREKARELARLLARRQRRLEHRVIPIAEAQLAMKEAVRPELLLVLYRRLMLRIAERVAKEVDASAIATGETIGQVASQTLGNLRAIEAAAVRYPVLRPLATYDKEETIVLARRLGCFDVSVRPAEDCCQLFLPRRPATRVPWLVASSAEKALDPERLADEAAARAETEVFG